MNELSDAHIAQCATTVSRGVLVTQTATTVPWSDGVTYVDAPFTGLHLAHVAVGACVLNDVYREAAPRGIAVAGVRVGVRGAYDPIGRALTPIEYVLQIASDAPPSQIEELAAHVERVAEIPGALAAAVAVTRIKE